MKEMGYGMESCGRTPSFIGAGYAHLPAMINMHSKAIIVGLLFSLWRKYTGVRHQLEHSDLGQWTGT